MSNVGVHATHCCKPHGCKYGDDDCPVAGGKVDGIICEMCSDEHEEREAILRPIIHELVKLNPGGVDRLGFGAGARGIEDAWGRGYAHAKAQAIALLEKVIVGD